jgi:hypothetical protein
MIAQLVFWIKISESGYISSFSSLAPAVFPQAVFSPESWSGTLVERLPNQTVSSFIVRGQLDNCLEQKTSR